MIENIMIYTDIENIPGFLILVEFEKAFDSLEWHYIFSSSKVSE